MSFPRYKRYRSSGVEWLGEIPEHWQAAQIKRVATIRYGIGEPPEYREGGVPLVRATNVSSGKIHREGMVYVNPEDIAASRIVWLSPGDIIVVRSGAYTGDSAIIPSSLGKAIAGFDMVLRCHSINPDFLQLALLAHYLKESQIDLQRMRAAQPHLNAEELGACQVVFPCRSEQECIVAALTPKILEIETLLAETSHAIELLKEKRQAVISTAVTRGLNQNVRMKSSGIGWIGKIPEYWVATPIKRVTKVESGHTPDKKIDAYWTDGTIPWVSLNDTGFLRDNDFISETAHNTTLAGIENSSARILPANAVVFSRDATIGRCAITTREMAVSQHFIAWICGPRVLPMYLLHVCRSMTEELERLTLGATVKTIGMADINALAMPLPPLIEQQRINEHIREETCYIDHLIAKVDRAGELLRERLYELISAAVTGKIDLRDAVGRATA